MLYDIHLIIMDTKRQNRYIKKINKNIHRLSDIIFKHELKIASLSELYNR